MSDWKDNEHFRYELQMLYYCYRKVESNHTLALQGFPDQAAFNAYHESFMVHAKNLLEFLQTKCILDDPNVYVEMDKLFGMIDDQIVSLDLERRKSDASDKLTFPAYHNKLLELVNMFLNKTKAGIFEG